MQRWHPDLTPHGMETAATSARITRELEQATPEFHRLEGSIPCLCAGSRTGQWGPRWCPVHQPRQTASISAPAAQSAQLSCDVAPLARLGSHPVGCTTQKQPSACGLLAWIEPSPAFFLAEKLTPGGGLLNQSNAVFWEISTWDKGSEFSESKWGNCWAVRVDASIQGPWRCMPPAVCGHPLYKAASILAPACSPAPSG